MSVSATVTGLLEAALYVEDLDRSAAFYQDLFGFEVEVKAALVCVLRVPGRQALILFPRSIASYPGGTPPIAREGVNARRVLHRRR